MLKTKGDNCELSFQSAIISISIPHPNNGQNLQMSFGKMFGQKSPKRLKFVSHIIPCNNAPKLTNLTPNWLKIRLAPHQVLRQLNISSCRNINHEKDWCLCIGAWRRD